MFDPSSFANPTLLAHADTSRDVLPRGVPIMAQKVILELVKRSKNITEADSDDENEINNAATVPTSSEMKNIMKSMCCYLESHSNGERNNKMDAIEQFVDNLRKTFQRKTSDYFPKTK
ncbi:hypothetical protein TNCV_1257671 [Trichonephila clavipes]|nr:hypothetical protein TNCV_1257671 [Trichonephila clavipes]